MEQQDPTPCTPSTIHRDSRSARAAPSPSPSPTPSPDATLQTTPQPTTSSFQNPLSFSEPTLRFPLPQGSRHLANWISASDPDIMRIHTTTEDTGLSDSTYELISGTDSESQDGNYTESISESVGSLDFPRADDVHSLAGTETNDDESVADDEVHAQLTPDDSHDEELDGTLINQLQAAVQQELATEPEPESESDDECRSRSSLEYTQQSLKTPSIQTPEASKILVGGVTEDEKPKDSGSDSAEIEHTIAAFIKSSMDSVRGFVIPVVSRLADPFTLVILSLSFATLVSLVALVIPLLISTASTPPGAVPGIAGVTPPLALPSSATSSSPRVTSTGDMGLIPFGDTPCDDWLFVRKKPALSLEKLKPCGHYIIHMPTDTKKAWLDQECFKLSAKRDGNTGLKRDDKSIHITSSSVPEGIAIEFPFEETYGTVKLNIVTKCRPRIHKSINITFPKGIVEEALEITKLLAQDFTDLAPAVAQEVERRIEDAKRTLSSSTNNVVSVSDSLVKSLSMRFNSAHRSLGQFKADTRDRIHDLTGEMSKQIGSVVDQALQHLPDTQDVKEMAELRLLDAQLSAKIFYLKLAGTQEQYNDYRSKAMDHMARKEAEAKHAHFRRHADANYGARQRFWSTILQHRCHNRLVRGPRGYYHDCDHVV
ncbi:hypothetical protein G7046_g9872 [Stylonectria norvegica]|nr:hypothetical protein G7046_g9872 [Stylonectria norvegica]